MKNILKYLLFMLAFPVFLKAQYTGGNGRGDAALSLTNFPLPVQEASIEVPVKFILAQNYPNPLNPVTKIQYTIPQPSKVIIKVFNILGNELQTLVEQEKPAGSYEITWHAENLPSGVYCYQLHAIPANGTADSFLETKKMIVLK